MDYGILDFIYLIGSLGLFLYGMKIMSEGLQKVAGDRMKSILAAMTSNRVFGVFTGILITALVQSSSATTLMVVSFANASLLNLAQAVSVIMGANIGTTVTAWIISLLGFKVDISAFAVPLIAVAIPSFQRSKVIILGATLSSVLHSFSLGYNFSKIQCPTYRITLRHSPSCRNTPIWASARCYSSC